MKTTGAANTTGFMQHCTRNPQIPYLCHNGYSVHRCRYGVTQSHLQCDLCYTLALTEECQMIHSIVYHNCKQHVPRYLLCMVSQQVIFSLTEWVFADEFLSASVWLCILQELLFQQVLVCSCNLCNLMTGYGFSRRMHLHSLSMTHWSTW